MKTARASVLLLVGAALCVTRVCWAAGGAIVEIPTAQTTSAASSDQDLTMAGEYKSTRSVIEQEKPVFWDLTFYVAYMSEYNFRGTNLTPDADGVGYIRADVSKWGFTLGLAEFHQFGTARTNSFSAGEGGGGGTGGFTSSMVQNPLFPIGPRFLTASGTTSPETIQNRFNEIDVFLQYQFALGPVDVTLGDIGFFIDRRAMTFVAVKDVMLSAPGFPGFGPFLLGNFHLGPAPTVEDEKFDRLYITLSTSKIPHIQPQVTYYQTILNTGQQPSAVNLTVAGALAQLGIPVSATSSYRGGERNDELGGFLEGKLKGNFAITNWFSFNPYGIISVSFHDRSEPVPVPRNKKDTIRGRSLSGFNVAQAGLELPIHLLHTIGGSTGPYAPPNLDLYFIPFGWYSYHISDPVPSTNRHEAWGGARLTATF
jgi:hypothetical protein